MRPTSPTRVRLGLLGVFALLAVALVAPTVSGQIRPGQPNIPRPPQPGLPNIPKPPVINIPKPPVMNPPGIPGMGGPNIPGMGGPNIPGMGGGGLGGGGIFENVYYCKKCNVVLGRGNFPPASATCTGCGLTYNNGIAFDDGRPGKPNPGGLNVPGMGGPVNPPVNPGVPGGFNPGGMPVNNPNPQFPVNNAPVPPPGPVFGNDENKTPEKPPVEFGTPVGGSDIPATPSPTVPKSSNKTLFIIGGIVLALLVVLGMVVAVLYLKSTEKQKGGTKRRKVLVGDDDD